MLKRNLLLFFVLFMLSFLSFPFYMLFLLITLPEYLVDGVCLATYIVIWIIAYIINYIDWRRNNK